MPQCTRVISDNRSLGVDPAGCRVEAPSPRLPTYNLTMKKNKSSYGSTTLHEDLTIV